MTDQLAAHLVNLADKYETATFPEKDPSQFLRWYDIGDDNIANVECASFIAAMLAFGNRKQFIPKIREVLETADRWCANNKGNKGDRPLDQADGVAQWCLAGAPDFPHGEKKFYRFYSYDDMHCLFTDLANILGQAPTLGQYLFEKYSGCPALDQLISEAFPNTAIVPKGKNSANKRIHMFLRWMVRPNSPVDLGLWSWANSADLLIPLDVHVMEEGINLGLLPPNAKASRKTAIQLSKELEKAFPGDPARADFALFGLGVDETVD